MYAKDAVLCSRSAWLSECDSIQNTQSASQTIRCTAGAPVQCVAFFCGRSLWTVLFRISFSFFDFLSSEISVKILNLRRRSLSIERAHGTLDELGIQDRAPVLVLHIISRCFTLSDSLAGGGFYIDQVLILITHRRAPSTAGRGQHCEIRRLAHPRLCSKSSLRVPRLLDLKFSSDIYRFIRDGLLEPVKSQQFSFLLSDISLCDGNRSLKRDSVPTKPQRDPQKDLLAS